MNKPIVSVIIPVYNVEKYLKECVDSVLNQTYQNLDIILIDDGSSDDSGLLCDQFELKDSRIRVIHKVNGGLSSARNAGIDIALGDFIFFVDSDDKIVENAVEILLEFMLKNDLDLLLSEFTRDKKNLTHTTEKQLYICTKEDVVSNVLLQKNQELYSVAAPTKMYRRELFENIRFPVGRLNEDMAVILLILHKAQKIGASDYITYYYRINDQSITNQNFSKSRMDLIDMTQEMQAQIQNYFPTHVNEGKVLMYSRAFELYSIAKRTDKKNVYEEEKDYLKTLIKENRIFVLKSRKVRKKALISAILSYISVDMVSNIIIFLKRTYR